MCYNSTMGKNIFIAGKELPGVAGFAEGFVLKENLKNQNYCWYEMFESKLHR